ncbi:MAG: SAM-dependent methyltransferase [bacterium]
MKSSDTAFRMAPLTISGAAVPAVTRRSVLHAFSAGAAGIVLSPAAYAQAVARDAVVIRSDSSPYVPTPQKVVDEMLRMGRLGAKDFIVDLGSGDGRIIITAAQRMGVRGFGVDLDAELVRYANAGAKQAGVSDRVEFFQRDIFKTDLSGADVVTMYLLPEVNMMARPKLLAELRPGARVVTHDYHFEDWLPDDRITLDVPEKKVGTPGLAYVYMWIVPGQGAGRWQGRMPVAGGQTLPVELDLEQRFQILTGTVSLGGRPAKLVFAEMIGNDLSVIFSAEVGGRQVRHEIRASTRGDEAAGTVRAGHETPPPVLPGQAVLSRTVKRKAYLG